MADYRELVNWLVDLGIESVPHTQKNYLAHLIAVYRLMEQFDLEDELCRAGMFHSIYGTERFQGFKLPVQRRSEVAQLIGSRAERLAYWNCFMDRSSFDRMLDQDTSSFTLRHRETGEQMLLDVSEYEDLCRVHLFDWLEQVPRSSFGWAYRRDAYRRMAKRGGSRACEAYDKVFAAEPRA